MTTDADIKHDYKGFRIRAIGTSSGWTAIVEKADQRPIYFNDRPHPSWETKRFASRESALEEASLAIDSRALR